jgi:hypothetical protein
VGLVVVDVRARRRSVTGAGVGAAVSAEVSIVDAAYMIGVLASEELIEKGRIIGIYLPLY